MNNKIKSFVKHPLFSGSAVMIGGSMVANVINYVYHLIVGRLLGPVNYGVLASLFSILYIVGIVPTSTSVAIVKFVSSGKETNEISAVYYAINKLVLKVAIVLGILVFLVSPLISNFLKIDNPFLVVFVAPILFFSLMTLVNQATSQGLLKFMGWVVPNIVSSLIKIFLGVFLILLGFSVFGAMGAVMLGAILAYFMSVSYIRKIKNSKPGNAKYNLKPFLVYSLPVLLQALSFTSLFTTDIILVKHFLSPFDAGIYAALSTLGKIIFFASSPISSVMFPVVAGRNAKGEKYHKVFWLSFIATLFISLAIVVFYYLFPNLAIGILYGKAYLSAKTSLVRMGLFIFIYTMSVLLVNFSLSLGKTKVIVFPLFAAICQVVFIWIFHNSIIQVIQVSTIVCSLMFVGLSLNLGYNSLGKTYEKR